MEILWISLQETLTMSVSTLWKVSIILVPLTIGVEILRDLGWLPKIAKCLTPATKLLDLPGEAAIGILVGMLSGVIHTASFVDAQKATLKLSQVQANTIFIWMGLTHALFNEAAYYTGLGINIPYVMIQRFLVGTAIAYCYMLVIRVRKKQRMEEQESTAA
ncbi:nucleoside recognition domain-containing protein [Christensenella sp. MSJ-20]|uniref:nucleoside recognition domain-containing protein n=1 Tax=Christensenella sp. MSJ-20 TaxID=2841518 RepID=UPI000D7B271B|nr:MAG: hypothetical protein DBY42_03090 [Bacillota bacterium]QWT55536.1 nucleoside recognition domain-containing protein [Christensenella sp. MSJ-20]